MVRAARRVHVRAVRRLPARRLAELRESFAFVRQNFAAAARKQEGDPPMPRCAFAAAALLVSASPALAQMGPSQVAVAPALEAKLREGRTFVGTVRPLRTSAVGAEAPGLVVELLAREGDRVKAGQALARLRTTSLDIRVEAAKAELELRREELRELENGTRAEEVEEARARLEAARALEAYWLWRLESEKRLFEAKTNSENDLQTAVSESRQAAARRAEAEAAWRLAEAGPRPERIGQARARVAVQEQEVARLLDERQRHTIAAPYDGYVLAERTQVGQWLAVGDPVVEIAELDRVEIELQIAEDAIARVDVGAEAAVEIPAVASERFVGKVARIVARADPRARTFPARIALDNRPSGSGVLLKAGMLARVTLAVGEPVRAVLVPKDAVVLGGPAPLLFVVREQKAAAVPVQLGVARGSLIQVIGAVAGGDDVVVRGNERLGNGASVIVAERLETE